MAFVLVPDDYLWLRIAPALLLPALVIAPLTRSLLATRERLRHLEVEVERLGLTDPLTALPNRGAFFDHARHTFGRPLTAQNLVTALMVDIDDLKAVNDEYGHETGDMLLRGVANAVRDAVAASGAVDWMVARTGGDEFAVIAESLLPSAVGRLADRICQQVRRVIRAARGEQVSVTASVGVAFRGEGMDVDGLMKIADDAVVLARRGGRDRWAFALGTIERSADEPPPTIRQAVTVLPRPAVR